MPTSPKRGHFLESEEGNYAKQSLEQIDADAKYKTEPSYSANAEKYPNNIIPFIDKHMKYLSEHQGINLEHYLSNLRLMTRKR